MAKKRSGWERMLYIGAAGSTAATSVETATDVDIGHGHGYNSSTTRGDGTSAPKEVEQQVSLKADPSFKFIYKDTDAAQITIIAAEQSGTALAVKMTKHSGGVVEFDGDCYLDATASGPLTGGQEVEITCHPTDDGGRDWSYT